MPARGGEMASATNELTLPLMELAFGGERALKAYARRIGRAYDALTFDEFIRFLDDRGAWYEGRRDPERIRAWFEPIAQYYARFATVPEAREAIFERAPSGKLWID